MSHFPLILSWYLHSVFSKRKAKKNKKTVIFIFVFSVRELTWLSLARGLNQGRHCGHIGHIDSYSLTFITAPAESTSFTTARPAPMAHSYRPELVAWRYQIRIPLGPDICRRGCAYTVLQIVQRPGMYSAAYGTALYKEPLKSCAILPWLYR